MGLAALAMILFGVAARLLPHPPNVAPIAAMALFGGAYLPKKYAFLIPILAMLISDYFIGFWGAGMILVYGSFILAATLGLLLRDKRPPLKIVSLSLVSSLLFFLITNIPWLHPNTWYTKDLVGLLASYANALPFFRNTLLGDLGYTIGFFGAYESAKYLGKLYLPAKVYRLAF